MRYIKSKRIGNVSGFCPNNGDYAYTEGERGYLCIDGVLLEKDDAPLELSLRGKYMYVWYGSGKFELYEGHTLLNSIERNVILLNEQTQYIGKSYAKFNPFRKGYNFSSPIDEQLVLSEFVPDRLYVEDNLIIAYNNFRGEFKRINTETEILWQYSLSSLGGSEYESDKTDKIDKILGIAHGNIWFYTKFYRLVALDLETGKKVHSLDCFGVYLDEVTKDIFAIASNGWTIIDTQTFTIKEDYFFSEEDPEGMGQYESVYKPLLQGDYFTFLGEKEEDYGGIRWAGIFDYKARKLVWEYEVISEEECDTTRNQLVTSQPLYMSGNELYIKDIKDNLHIFEREDI
ncbi:hypothetical protein SAMN02745202_01933 [Segatella oulorum]|uniref:PQQ-like domain-containing protein n=1 Tax=Segatella oulorum TaxID=28136 RepID=A0A1T4QRU2_9BACT|nr:hypothetical protein [Segatella oulorum]SKA06472.1 hypothetical protein SAMN02745202_01933 [Segatella oulorum]